MIYNNPWIDPRLQDVRPEAAKAYMLKNGWQIDPRTDDRLWVFAGPLDDDGEPIIEILPTSKKTLDFPLRIEELVRALSIIEDRYARDVLDDILKEAENCEGHDKTNGAAIKTKKKLTKRKR